MELKRVVVTGIGCVSPLGNNAEETWKKLLDGVSGAAPITHFDASLFKTKFACELKDFNAADYIDRKEARKMDPYCQYALAAATMAVDDSAIDLENIDKNRVIVSVLRFILALIRTLPTLVIALVCALIFGLGTFAGTLAISIFTFGIVAKMLYESIETIDMGPFEAMEAMGANKFQAFWSACVPQILPVYLSHSLYCFEMNVRASAILGYVGAGGLGITINERIGWRDYEGLGMVLLTLFVVVVAIEFTSEYLRGKLS